MVKGLLTPVSHRSPRFPKTVVNSNPTGHSGPVVLKGSQVSNFKLSVVNTNQRSGWLLKQDGLQLGQMIKEDSYNDGAFGLLVHLKDALTRSSRYIGSLDNLLIELSDKVTVNRLNSGTPFPENLQGLYLNVLDGLDRIRGTVSFVYSKNPDAGTSVIKEIESNLSGIDSLVDFGDDDEIDDPEWYDDVAAYNLGESDRIYEAEESDARRHLAALDREAAEDEAEMFSRHLEAEAERANPPQGGLIPAMAGGVLSNSDESAQALAALREKLNG